MARTTDAMQHPPHAAQHGDGLAAVPPPEGAAGGRDGLRLAVPVAAGTADASGRLAGALDQPADYGRKWHVMAAVGTSILLATLDSSIVNVALPTLVRDFRTDLPTVQWVVLGYLLTLATLLAGVGRLGDMLGKKRIFTLGFLVFIGGSFLCGLAPGVYWLIGFRVLQALGATMLLALGTAILTEAFPPSERGRALGLGGSIVSLGIVLGPTVGGLLINALSWHWIFMVNVPIGLVGTYIAWRSIPSVQPRRGQRFDYLGALTFCVFLLSFLLALTLGEVSGAGGTAGSGGFTQAPVLLLLASAALSLAAFVWVELRVDQPMIDVRLFRNQQLSLNLITGALTFVSISGVVFLMPFYLQNVLGFNVLLVGLLLASVPVGMGIVSPLSGSIADRLGTGTIALAGLVVLTIGYALATTLDEQTTPLGYVLRLLPIAIGMGLFQSPNNSAIMGAAPREQLGVVSGLLSLTRTVGQMVGIAVLGALWASRLATLADGPLTGGATGAPAALQVRALHDTLLVTVGLVAAATILGVWGLVHGRRAAQGHQRRPVVPEPSLH